VFKVALFKMKEAEEKHKAAGAHCPVLPIVQASNCFYDHGQKKICKAN
jgi:hypothetical protein